MNNYVLPLITSEIHLPFYVYSVGGMANQIPVHRLNGYPHYVWLHTIQGKGKLSLDGAQHTLDAHSGVLLYPHSAYEYCAAEEPWETHWVAFQGYAVEPLLRKNGLSGSECLHLPHIPLLDHHIHNVFVSAISNHPESGLVTSGKLYEFLIELIRCVNQERSGAGATAYRRLQPVIAYIEQHLEREITLESLASVIGVSPQYLCRIFKQAVQMSPVVYLIRLRLQKAKELLLERSELSVAEVGSRVGFHAPSYFSSVFKQHEGMTPLEFRRSYR